MNDTPAAYLGIHVDKPDSHNGEFTETVKWEKTMKFMEDDMREFRH
jgi:hypothetical protein